MNKLELQKFIEEKSNRQIVLKERMVRLNTLDEQLSSSKIVRWFGSAYLITRQFITLILGIILILGSIVFFFFPEIIFKEENLRTEIIQEYKNKFSKANGAPLDLKIEEVSKNYSKPNAVFLIQKIDESIQLSIENETKNKFQFIAILGIILGLMLVYIARLTKNIKFRNSKLSDAETLTKAIIEDYKLTIDEEEKELEILREYLNGMS
jgi:hypothetical protein